jgi:coniferyl-aldehyde dehydrogenase
VCGGPEIAEAVARLPLDHLFFTGSTRVGRLVMRAASENLTPVTLELGGKSPAVVGPDADLDHAALRIMQGKLFSAGQTCIAPDYAVVPADKHDAFVAACRRAAHRLYPTFAGNPDYSSIINQRHRARLHDLVGDATARGARVVALETPAPPHTRAPDSHFPPALLLDVTDDMTVMQEEIFGPLLPIRTFRWLGEALDELEQRPRPLALYYFGQDRATCDDVIARTLSGGICINDTMVQALQHDLPFGGIGPSGMGHYHGREGFLTFSKLRPVLWSTAGATHSWLSPPYREAPARLIRWLLGSRPGSRP